MPKVLIPGEKKLPAAIRYMISLGDRRLGKKGLDRLDLTISTCKLVNHYCLRCFYPEQCNRLYDNLVDRAA